MYGTFAQPTPSTQLNPTQTHSWLKSTRSHTFVYAPILASHSGTNGPSWVLNDGWLASREPCNYHGVTCQDGAVTELDLSWNSLSGPLPTEIGLLTDLMYGGQYFDGLFHFNDLTGSLPSEIGLLTDMTESL